jgi:hypothetical protein
MKLSTAYEELTGVHICKFSCLVFAIKDQSHLLFLGCVLCTDVISVAYFIRGVLGERLTMDQIHTLGMLA